MECKSGASSISPVQANNLHLMHTSIRKDAMRSKEQFFIKVKGPVKKKSWNAGGRSTPEEMQSMLNQLILG